MTTAFLTLLEERCQARLDDSAREYIAHAVQGATRMSHLVRGLLEYSRVSSGGRPLQPTDSGAALGTALEYLSEAIKEVGAAVTHGALPIVMSDSTQLIQVFQNLVGNAVKFRAPERPCRVHVSAQNAGDMWEFAVADNGIGIPEGIHDRIFLIFQRAHTRETYAGTGIGLAICKRIVDRNGGRIRVESQPGQGATFFFTLPGVNR